MARKLLIADDALIMRTMIRDVAVAAGWTVVAEAADGQQAVDLYRKHQPDVVTMDMVMPVHDGMHGLKEIRRTDPRARVLVVSALEQSAVLKEAFKQGAADFIVKPFDQTLLAQTLDRLCPEPAAV